MKCSIIWININFDRIKYIDINQYLLMTTFLCEAYVTAVFPPTAL